MPLTLERKQAVVAETRMIAETAVSTVVADYRGMTVAEVTQLRKQAREAGVRLVVIRNTLAKRAFEGTECECLEAVLRGPTMLGFSQEDPGAGARLLRAYGIDCPALDIKAVALNGELYGQEHVAKIASLPTREEALAQLLSVLKAPIAKLAQTLHAVPVQLVRTLVAIKEQKSANEL